MKPYTFATIVGASCLLATYPLTRGGSIILAVIVMVLIGVIGGVVSVVLNGRKNNLRIGLLIMSFAIGALVSEVVSFAHYYFTYGYHDSKLFVGVDASVLEFCVITIVGGLAMFSSTIVARRRTGPHAGS